MNVEHFEYLWKGPDAAGALLLVRPLPGQTSPQYAIGDLRDGTLLFIEIDEIGNAVEALMLQHGVPILSAEEFPPLAHSPKSSPGRASGPQGQETKMKKHTTDRIIRKLSEAEALSSEGQGTAAICQCWRSAPERTTAGTRGTDGWTKTRIGG